MRADNLLRKTGKKLWIIVTSEKDERELGLEKLIHNRLLFIPKPYDQDIIEETVNQIAKFKADEKRASKNSTRRLLAWFLGREA